MDFSGTLKCIKCGEHLFALVNKPVKIQFLFFIFFLASGEMSAYPYAFNMWSPEKLEKEMELAYARKKYWEERVATLEKIKKMSEMRYRRRDTYYTRDDLLAADEIEQKAAELERASEVESEAKKAFDKVQWFLGQGENFPHFLTKAWRNEALQDFTKRRHVDELYDKYREVVKSFVASGQTLKAEEMVGDFLFLLNQIVRARKPAASWRNY